MGPELTLIKSLVLAYCAQKGQRTFRLQEFTRFAKPHWQRAYPDNHRIEDKIRQQLQNLRKENLLTFVDNRGTYTSRDEDLHIPGELDFNAVNAIEQFLEDTETQVPPKGAKGSLKISEAPNLWDRESLLRKTTSRAEKREYIQEVFARDPKWMSAAKRLFKSECMMGDCSLTFAKPDGSPYIEVHHIKPLCEDGENDIWNLATICAHHHRMAHFANEKLKQHVYDTLMRENAKRLKILGVS